MFSHQPNNIKPRHHRHHRPPYRYTNAPQSLGIAAHSPCLHSDAAITARQRAANSQRGRFSVRPWRGITWTATWSANHLPTHVIVIIHSLKPRGWNIAQLNYRWKISENLCLSIGCVSPIYKGVFSTPVFMVDIPYCPPNYIVYSTFYFLHLSTFLLWLK